MSGLPEGWLRVPLEDLRSAAPNAITDGPYGSNLKSSHYCEKGARVIRLGNIGSGIYIERDIAYVALSHFNDLRKHQVNEGDLVVAALGDPIGRACIVPGFSEPAIVKADCFRFSVSDKAIKEFVLYWLNSEDAREGFVARSHGMGRIRINLSDFKGTEIPLAPLPEQRRIVAKIDSLTAKSRRARDHLDHIPRLVEKYKHAVLEAAFRGDLTREWRHRRPPHGDASGVHERLTDLPLLPADWVWASMGALGQISGGLTKNPARNGLPIRVPYLRVANVYANQLRLDEVAEIGCTPDERQKTLLVPGDLLIVEGNGSLDQIGRVAIWNGELPQCSHQNHLIKIRLNDVVSPEFALFWLMSPQGRNAIQSVASSSAGLFSLSISKVRGLPIPICAAEQQRRVVDRIRVALTWIDRLAAEATSARTLVDRLDQAVLAKAFRGELVPQDPADEPASVLLDRIRAERAAAPKPKRGRRPRAAA